MCIAATACRSANTRARSRIKLRVHSVILSSASKTFMAMFGPHFSEGQDLSSTSPKEVELPDDDPTSMLHLCNTLHHKANFEGPQDVDGLLALAIHCDKYDCLHAMKFASAIWLDRMVSTCDKFAAELEKISATVEARSGNSAKVVKLLAAAYLFESPLAFGRISALPLLRFEGPFSEAQCGSIIPWRAFSKQH